jgi:anti-anti-sigma regulatory factor
VSEGRILYAIRDRVCLLAMSGTIRFTLSARLDAFLRRLFAEGLADETVADLNAAEHLDSTMLGLLARAARYSQKRSGRRPRIYCDRDDMVFLLETTGFEACADVLPGRPVDCGPLQELPPTPDTPMDRVTRVLEAHRTLMSLNAENEGKFRDAVSLLERERERHAAGNPGHQ